ncbi:hypothetical protein QOT17_022096 [Balamuthia mandrillaris]
MEGGAGESATPQMAELQTGVSATGGVPTLAAPPLEGWLQKQGVKGLRAWKRRWFKQRGNKLYYYKQENQGAEPQGCIPCSQITEVRPTSGPALSNNDHAAASEEEGSNKGNKKGARGGGGGFEVVTPNRTFSLWAASDTELKYWVHGLQNWLAAAEKRTERLQLSGNGDSDVSGTEMHSPDVQHLPRKDLPSLLVASLEGTPTASSSSMPTSPALGRRRHSDILSEDELVGTATLEANGDEEEEDGGYEQDVDDEGETSSGDDEHNSDTGGNKQEERRLRKALRRKEEELAAVTRQLLSLKQELCGLEERVEAQQQQHLAEAESYAKLIASLRQQTQLLESGEEEGEEGEEEEEIEAEDKEGTEKQNKQEGEGSRSKKKKTAGQRVLELRLRLKETKEALNEALQRESALRQTLSEKELELLRSEAMVAQLTESGEESEREKETLDSKKESAVVERLTRERDALAKQLEEANTRLSQAEAIICLKQKQLEVAHSNSDTPLPPTPGHTNGQNATDASASTENGAPDWESGVTESWEAELKRLDMGGMELRTLSEKLLSAEEAIREKTQFFERLKDSPAGLVQEHMRVHNSAINADDDVFDVKVAPKAVLEQQVKRLKAELEEERKAREEIEEEKMRQEEQLMELKFTLMDEQLKVSSLESEKEALEKSVSELMEEMEKETAMMVSMKKRFMEEVDEEEFPETEGGEENDTEEKEHSNKTTPVRRGRKSLGAQHLAVELSLKEEELVKMSKDLETLKRKYEGKNILLSVDLKRTTQLLEEKEKHVKSLKARIAELEQNDMVQTLKTQNSLLTKEMERMEQDYKQQIKSLEETLSHQQQELESVKQAHTNLKQQLSNTSKQQAGGSSATEFERVKQELFFSLAIGIKLNLSYAGKVCNKNVYALYEQAKKQNIDYRRWSTWIHAELEKS